MNKEETKKQIEKLREEIRHHDRRYYADDNPEISDAQYDKLMRRLQGLEAQYPCFVTPDSPTQRVGGKPLEKFGEVRHRTTMLSLANAFSAEELTAFDARVKKEAERLLEAEGRESLRIRADERYEYIPYRVRARFEREARAALLATIGGQDD